MQDNPSRRGSGRAPRLWCAGLAALLGAMLLGALALAPTALADDGEARYVTLYLRDQSVVRGLLRSAPSAYRIETARGVREIPFDQVEKLVSGLRLDMEDVIAAIERSVPPELPPSPPSKMLDLSKRKFSASPFRARTPEEIAELAEYSLGFDGDGGGNDAQLVESLEDLYIACHGRFERGGLYVIALRLKDDTAAMGIAGTIRRRFAEHGFTPRRLWGASWFVLCSKQDRLVVYGAMDSKVVRDHPDRFQPHSGTFFERIGCVEGAELQWTGKPLPRQVLWDFWRAERPSSEGDEGREREAAREAAADALGERLREASGDEVIAGEERAVPAWGHSGGPLFAIELEHARDASAFWAGAQRLVDAGEADLACHFPLHNTVLVARTGAEADALFAWLRPHFTDRELEVYRGR